MAEMADAPVLLVGDFNSEPGDAVMRFLGSDWKLPAKPAHDRLTWRADAPTVEIDQFKSLSHPALTYFGSEKPGRLQVGQPVSNFAY